MSSWKWAASAHHEGQYSLGYPGSYKWNSAKSIKAKFAEFPFYEVGCIAWCLGGGARSSWLLLLLVLLGQAYPAHHAPGVEVAGELVLIAVARNQHDDTPLVDVLQVHRGCGPQIA